MVEATTTATTGVRASRVSWPSTRVVRRYRPAEEVESHGSVLGESKEAPLSART